MTAYAVSVFVPDLTVPVPNCRFGSNEGGWFMVEMFDSKDSAQKHFDTLAEKKAGEVTYRGRDVAGYSIAPYPEAKEQDEKSRKLLGA